MWRLPDREQVIVGQTQKSTKKTITVAKGLMTKYFHRSKESTSIESTNSVSKTMKEDFSKQIINPLLRCVPYMTCSTKILI